MVRKKRLGTMRVTIRVLTAAAVSVLWNISQIEPDLIALRGEIDAVQISYPLCVYHGTDSATCDR